MADWYKVIQEQLDLAWLAPSTTLVPFGVVGIPASDWQSPRLESISDSHWTLTAHTATGLEAVWHLQAFPDTRAVECWGRIVHRGTGLVRGIRECLTLDVDLQLPDEFGQPWVRSINGVQFLPNYFPPHDFAVTERQLVFTPQVFTPLTLTGLDDGRPSGGNLPCAIVCDERRRHGLACFLEWAGLWRIALQLQARRFGESRPFSALRAQIGLSGLQLDLEPGQSLPLPRVLMTAFDGDLDSGANTLRRHIRRHVSPKLNGQDILPPTSFNHWFAFENAFTSESLKPAVDASAQAGFEYFCVDGGWFKGDFRDGIGNWDDGDPTKFPQGIKPFSDYVRSKGLKYGTWFEPEWAHQNSELYRQHPDWFWPSPPDTVWQLPGRSAFFKPNIHLMNFGLSEVRQWWLARFIRAYEEWGMRWVRWDYNQMPRPNWDNAVPSGKVGWRQIEHVTGFYQVLDAIIAACPDLFIEQCASGGHRIELGTVRRGHSFWMNDHTTQTDLVRALQQGLNVVLPGNYANTNLCQFRHDFTDYDYLSHGMGSFGYSGRLWEAPTADFARLADAVTRFKSYRHILTGDYHRPTGQPAKATDYSKVVFQNGQEGLEFEFNLPGKPRSARMTVTHQ